MGRRRTPIPNPNLIKAGFYKNNQAFIESKIPIRPITDLEIAFRDASTVVLVGAGPSLDKNIDSLIDLPKDALVFASDGAVGALAQKYLETGLPGYLPDIVCSCEIDGPHIVGKDRITSEKIFTMMKKAWLATMKDVPIIGHPSANFMAFEAWPNNDYYFYINWDEHRYSHYYDFHKDIHCTDLFGRQFPKIKPRTSIVGFHMIAVVEAIAPGREICLIGYDMGCPSDKYHHNKAFAIKQMSANQDKGYEGHLQWFREFYDCKWGDLLVVNCSEGGRLLDIADEALPFAEYCYDLTRKKRLPRKGHHRTQK